MRVDPDFVSTKELCYLKFWIAVLKWNEYNEAGTPVD